MEVGEVIKELQEDSWIEARQESSDSTFKKKGVADNVSVAGTDCEDVSPDVLSKLRRQTELPLRLRPMCC